MTTTPLVSVEHLSKKYSASLRRGLRHGLRDIARELVPFTRPEAGLRTDEFWALDDVSFSLDAGQALAIVGANGAGKSTLVRVMYGLLKPDRGTVRVRGQVEGLIDLGSGLNPVLTGRENILIAAALSGLGSTLRGGIADARTLQPLALFGWQDAPALLEVRSPSDLPRRRALVSNVRMSLNQLVTLDVDWE